MLVNFFGGNGRDRKILKFEACCLLQEIPLITILVNLFRHINISLLDFDSQLAGLHMHSTYTRSLAQSYENKKNSYADW